MGKRCLKEFNWLSLSRLLEDELLQELFDIGQGNIDPSLFLVDFTTDPAGLLQYLKGKPIAPVEGAVSALLLLIVDAHELIVRLLLPLAALQVSEFKVPHLLLDLLELLDRVAVLLDKFPVIGELRTHFLRNVFLFHNGRFHALLQPHIERLLNQGGYFGWLLHIAQLRLLRNLHVRELD